MTLIKTLGYILLGALTFLLIPLIGLYLICLGLYLIGLGMVELFKRGRLT